MQYSFDLFIHIHGEKKPQPCFQCLKTNFEDKIGCFTHPMLEIDIEEGNE